MHMNQSGKCQYGRHKVFKQKTLFIDIDGTLWIQRENDDIVQFIKNTSTNNMKILPGVIDKFKQWWEDGHIIILTTSRPESSRNITIKQLNSLGLFYHQLIMNLSSGNRYLINNRKKNNTEDSAFAINVNKNEGLTDVEIN